MGEYVARTTWQRQQGEAFSDNRYSRRHRLQFDGGADWLGSASPHVVRQPYSDPAGVDPEELFVASLSSCHMLWFLSIAAGRGFVVDRYDDPAIGTMARNAAGLMVMTRVVLHPQVDFSGERQPDRAEVEQMHHEAHAACFIANSVTSEVVCEPRWS